MGLALATSLVFASFVVTNADTAVGDTEIELSAVEHSETLKPGFVNFNEVVAELGGSLETPTNSNLLDENFDGKEIYPGITLHGGGDKLRIANYVLNDDDAPFVGLFGRIGWGGKSAAGGDGKPTKRYMKFTADQDSKITAMACEIDVQKDGTTRQIMIYEEGGSATVYVQNESTTDKIKGVVKNDYELKAGKTYYIYFAGNGGNIWAFDVVSDGGGETTTEDLSTEATTEDISTETTTAEPTTEATTEVPTESTTEVIAGAEAEKDDFTPKSGIISDATNASKTAPDKTDVDAALKVLQGKAIFSNNSEVSEAMLDAVDINNDGKLTIYDILKITKMAVEGNGKASPTVG